MERIIFFTLALIFFSCNENKVDKNAEGKKLMQISRDWSQAAATGDVEKTLSYWTDDAILISAGQSPLKGKQAIKQMVEGSFKIPGFRISWEPQTVEFSESGDLAYLIETSKITFPDTTGKLVTQNNNAVTIWRKQPDGAWKNVVDISAPDATKN